MHAGNYNPRQRRVIERNITRAGPHPKYNFVAVYWDIAVIFLHEVNSFITKVKVKSAN